MNFKKGVNGSWIDTPNYIHKTDTDTITTLPAIIHPTDTTATVGLKGNMSQSGTPTPTTPIQPRECGERTGNLIGIKDCTITFGNMTVTAKDNSVTFSGTYSGEIYAANAKWNVLSFTLSAGTYYIPIFVPPSLFIFVGFVRTVYDDNGNKICESNQNVFTLESETNCHLGFYIYKKSEGTYTYNAMLNTGSTALPYEPYGYKIPISSGGVNLCYLYKTGYRLNNAGNEVEAENFNIYTTSASANTTYTLNLDYSSVGTTTLRIIAYISGSFSYRIAEVNLNSVPYTFTTPSDCDEVKFSLSNQSTNIMLNRGSTALPYEPYVQPTETNTYLGEVQTTRKIRKLVLTGGEDENWNITNSSKVLYLAVSDFLKEQDTICYCTHYETVNNVSSADDVNDGECTFNDHLNWLYIKDSNYTSAQSFKNYLAQQYAAGTPVCVWYVLATPTTGIVNEPLMKIGDYADEVSGISTPTIAGTNTISVGTTLQPSEVTVNYKGWHPVADVHERENGQWD